MKILTAGSVRFSRSLDIIRVRLNRSLNLNRNLDGVRSALVHRTHGVSTRIGTITARRLPPGRCLECTDTSRDDSVARQRGLVGDSQNDEQRGDDL